MQHAVRKKLKAVELFRAFYIISRCDEIVTQEFLSIPQNTSYIGSSFLILGPPRIGKTKLCTMISDEIGAQNMNVDGIYHRIEREVLNERLRAFCMRSLILSLLRHSPKGGCIDFADSRYLLRKQSRFLIQKLGIKNIFVVTSKATASARLAAMHTHRKFGECWTSGHFTNEKLPELTIKITQECEEFAQNAKAAGIKTIFIEPDDFDGTLNSAVRQITLQLLDNN